MLICHAGPQRTVPVDEQPRPGRHLGRATYRALSARAPYACSIYIVQVGASVPAGLLVQRLLPRAHGVQLPGGARCGGGPVPPAALQGSAWHRSGPAAAARCGGGGCDRRRDSSAQPAVLAAARYVAASRFHSAFLQVQLHCRS